MACSGLPQLNYSIHEQYTMFHSVNYAQLEGCIHRDTLQSLNQIVRENLNPAHQECVDHSSIVITTKELVSWKIVVFFMY